MMAKTLEKKKVVEWIGLADTKIYFKAIKVIKWGISIWIEK